MYNDTNLKQNWVQDLFTDYVEDLKVSVELSSLVEKATRGQSCNPLWKPSRTFDLTLSNFGKILNKIPQTAPDNMIKFFCGYQTVPRTCQLAYGLEYESSARKLKMERDIRSHAAKLCRPSCFTSNTFPGS